MSNPPIHGKFLSGSAILEAAGDALSRIRQEDRLTWAELGLVLGKSEDQAAKYADGSAEMGIVAVIRAKQTWGERFTGGLNALTTVTRPVEARQAQSCVLRAALALAESLEDGELTVQEIRDNRSTLEKAQEAIAAQLSRLGPNSTAGEAA